MPPPLNLVLIELEILKTILESSQKIKEVLYILKMSKNAFYLAKNAGENQRFVKGFVMFHF